MPKQKFVCEKCGTLEYKNKVVTFPISLFGKKLNVGNVSIRECLKCNFRIPTEKGYEKLDRSANAFAAMMSE